MWETWVRSPLLGRAPGEGNGNPLQNSCLENPHGQRSLVGDGPWGCQELDTTAQLTLIIKIALDQVWRKRAWSYLQRPRAVGTPSRGAEWGVEPNNMCSIASLGRVGASLSRSDSLSWLANFRSKKVHPKGKVGSVQLRNPRSLFKDWVWGGGTC